jgi:chromosome condensin MukBEF ATPase and DNA-binding subunit MukB
MQERRVGDVSLREFIERILDERQTSLDFRFDAQQRALEVANRELDHWKLTHNEFRQQIEHERALYVTRDSMGTQLGALQERVSKMEARDANQDGRFWALGAGLSVLLTILALALRFWVGR